VGSEGVRVVRFPPSTNAVGPNAVMRTASHASGHGFIPLRAVLAHRQSDPGSHGWQYACAVAQRRPTLEDFDAMTPAERQVFTDAHYGQADSIVTDWAALPEHVRERINANVQRLSVEHRLSPRE
jgi:hypothetical protein